MGVLEAAQYLLDPWVFMACSAYYLPVTVFRLLRRGQFSTLFRWGRFKQAWFGTFWRWAGPGVATMGKNFVIPLLQGRVRHGRVLEEGEAKTKKHLAPPVAGTVIEVGPGSGMWVSVFGQIGVAKKSGSSSPSSRSSNSGSSRARKGSAATSGGVTKVYGVEPNAAQHAALQERIAAAGLDSVYEIVPLGIEDLATTGKVAKGSVDCVVSVLCLCGIPDPEHNIRELYGYLKPGGRMYVYEHVVVARPWLLRMYQRFINIFWPTFLGGCQLCRDTGRYLREAGPWTSVDVAQSMTEPWYHVVPHIVGVLTK